MEERADIRTRRFARAVMLACAAQAGSALAATDAERINALEQEVAQLGAGLSRRSEEGLPLHGFMDVQAGAQNKGGSRGFALGNLDLYLAPRVSDRIKGLIELNFELEDRGGIGIDMERLQIGYVFGDQATVWVGRFHSPWGYWNTAFHHGAQLQTSVTRPKFLEFEDRGGIIPAHSVGLWGTGSLSLDAGKITYDLFSGNNQRLTGASPGAATATLDPNMASSTNKGFSAGANVGYLFSGTLTGLKIGTHAFTARIDDDLSAGGGPADDRTRVRMAGGYLGYVTDDYELLGEYYRFKNGDLSGGTGDHQSSAAYVQAGKVIERWTPYARYERASLDQSDQYFAQQASGGSYKRSVAGIRYDLDQRAALKLELSRTSFTDRVVSSFAEVRAQWAIRF